MKKRNIAILAALTLLCGCSGNTGSTSSQPESVPATVEESAPDQTSVENSSAPAGVGNADDVAGSDSITTPAPESTTATGVSLGAGDWTEYDSTFKLNGTWCTPEELPLTRTEYQLPDKWSDKHVTYKARNGTLYLIATDVIYQKPCPPEVWYINLATGEERHVYTGSVFDNIVYTGEKYVAFTRPGTISDELFVVSAQTGNTVYHGDCTRGNYSLSPYLTSHVIYDTMYIGGEYTLQDFGKTVDAIFTLDLLTGAIGLFGINMSNPAYGSANLCWDEGGIKANLMGETATPYAYIGDKIVTSEMEGSYYTTTKIENYTDILGSKYQLYWTDHEAFHESTESDQHFIGETGYSISSYDFHITKDYIFTALLNPAGGDFPYMLIGKYDIKSDTARAALISVPDSGSTYTYADSYATYIVNYSTRKITMFRAGDNS